MKTLTIWPFLLAFSAFLLFWPIAPSPDDPAPIEVVSAVSNLPVFMLVLYLWSGALLILLFRKHSTGERLALCLVFALVFIGSWGIRAPWGNHPDSPWMLAHVQYLRDTGALPPAGHLTLRYFDFPALPLLALAIQYSTNLDPFSLMLVYTMASEVILVLLLYAVFRRMLNPALAPMAVMVALLSSKILAVVANQFHAINLATLQIAVFVLLLQRLLGEERRQTSLVLYGVLTLAVPTQYLFTPVLFAMVVLCAYVLSLFSKHRAPVLLAAALFPLVTLFAWEMYVTAHNFTETFGALPRTLRNLVNFQWLLPTRLLLSMNIGPAYPWWGNLSRAFWWGTLFFFCTIEVLWSGFNLRRSSVAQRTEFVFVVGALATVVIGFFSAPVIGVVHGGLSRYLWVAPFALAPRLVRLLSEPRRKRLAVAYVAASAMLFPATFVTNADSFSINRLYAQEVRGSVFLASVVPQADQSPLVNALPTFPTALFVFAPNIQVRAASYVYGVPAATAWELATRQQQAFLSRATGDVAIVSVKMRGEFQARLGIHRQDARWFWYDAQLDQVDRVYDNDFLTILVN